MLHIKFTPSLKNQGILHLLIYVWNNIVQITDNKRCDYWYKQWVFFVTIKLEQNFKSDEIVTFKVSFSPGGNNLTLFHHHLKFAILCKKLFNTNYSVW